MVLTTKKMDKSIGWIKIFKFSIEKVVYINYFFYIFVVKINQVYIVDMVYNLRAKCGKNYWYMQAIIKIYF